MSYLNFEDKTLLITNYQSPCWMEKIDAVFIVFQYAIRKQLKSDDLWPTLYARSVQIGSFLIRLKIPLGNKKSAADE